MNEKEFKNDIIEHYFEWIDLPFVIKLWFRVRIRKWRKEKLEKLPNTMNIKKSRLEKKITSNLYKSWI